VADSRIDDLRRRVQKDPASIAFAQLAEELRRAGEIDEAIATCRAGLAIHPGYLSARVTLGRALLEGNALDEGRHELETVLKSAPENLAAIRGLAEIYQRQGLLPEALAQYRAALALAKNDPDLQQTVTELAKIVEPQKPAHLSEGLSFEQMQQEIFGRDSGFGIRDSIETTDSKVESTPTNPEPRITNPDSEEARAERIVMELERFLTAVHVARTQPSA
jgi:tetratricopeptide (TPR) repeat protein